MHCSYACLSIDFCSRRVLSLSRPWGWNTINLVTISTRQRVPGGDEVEESGAREDRRAEGDWGKSAGGRCIRVERRLDHSTILIRSMAFNYLYYLHIL
jgi:hypothetical protein